MELSLLSFFFYGQSLVCYPYSVAFTNQGRKENLRDRGRFLEGNQPLKSPQKRSSSSCSIKLLCCLRLAGVKIGDPRNNLQFLLQELNVFLWSSCYQCKYVYPNYYCSQPLIFIHLDIFVEMETAVNCVLNSSIHQKMITTYLYTRVS